MVQLQAATRYGQPCTCGETPVGTIRSVPRVLRSFWVASFAAFALTVAVGVLRWRTGALATHYNPLSHTSSSDLLEYLPTFRLLHTARFFAPGRSPVAYPPFSVVLYALLYATGKPVAAFLAVAWSWLTVLTLFAARWLRRCGVPGHAAWLLPLTTLVMAFPVEAMLSYSNIELFLWMFAASGAWAWCRNRPTLAAVLWGCAAAMKLYPLVLLVLLLPRRHYRAVAAGVAAFAATTLMSLWYLGPTVAVAWSGSLRNVFGYQGQRVGEWTMHELASNHSAFTLVKFALRVFGVPFAAGTLPYYAAGAVVFTAVYFLRVARLPQANQLLFATAFMVLFPPISYAHTLVHLFAPLVLLLGIALDAEARGLPVPRLQRTLMLFVPLFASFMLLTERRLLLFGGLFQGAFLLGLFYSAARAPFAPALEPAAAQDAETEAASWVESIASATVRA